MPDPIVKKPRVKKPRLLTEKQKQVLAAKKARQDVKDAKLKAKKDKEEAKLRRAQERQKKIADREAKKNAIIWKKEQRELKKVTLIDNHTATTMMSKKYDGLSRNYRSVIKGESLTVLVVNPADPFQAVVSIETNGDWRNGHWFFDARTKKYLKFEKEKHKPAYGDKAILWDMFQSHLNNKGKEV